MLIRVNHWMHLIGFLVPILEFTYISMFWLNVKSKMIADFSERASDYILSFDNNKVFC